MFRKGAKMKQATVGNVLEIIEKADVLGEVEVLNKDVPLVEQDIDSLDLVNIYLLVEEEFEVKIPDEDLNKVKTIQEIIDYINQ
jgi:acyl carrier protein